MDSRALYPLKFVPILKEKIWGGERIKRVYRHDSQTDELLGESWDVSGMEGDESEVCNGFLEGNTLPDLLEVYMGDLVGDAVYERYGNCFPMLVKLLDAKRQLSIQVHPDDDKAEQLGEMMGGKNELWYVLGADEGASVIAGFEMHITEQQCNEFLERGELDRVLHRIPVEKGDVVYIPAGCVHSIGSGCTILEIQEPSDITYRLFDFNRKDVDGSLRELHIDKSLASIDWDNWKNDKLAVEVKTGELTSIIDRPCFTVNIMEIDKPKEYELGAIDSFIVLVCTEGHVTLKWDNDYITLSDMECVLIPAEMTSLMIVPTVKSRLIEAFIKA